MPANKEIDQLLLSYPEEVQLMTENARELIKSVLPGINEEADFPAKMLAYGFGAGYKHMICTIILSKKGIKIGFYKGTELPDPKGLLEGTGKVHRYVQVLSVSDVNTAGIKNLLKEAKKAYDKRISV
jgi:hypothetical protein